MQGRVACEIKSGDELVATEIIFAGVLSELEPEEAVALLSALGFQVRRLLSSPHTSTAEDTATLEETAARSRSGADCISL